MKNPISNLILVLIVAISALIGSGTGRAGEPTSKAAPSVSIYGCKVENPHRVLFMIDTSGSMIGVFGDVKANLKKTIIALPNKGDQTVEFNIIPFADEAEPHVLFKDGPEVDSPKNKKIACDFVDDMVASGQTEPIPAIDFALKTDPPADTIFFMTDGIDGPVADLDDIAEKFKKATADGKTKVNCIYFVTEINPKLEAMLKKIAEDSHGEYKAIQKSDMQ